MATRVFSDEELERLRSFPDLSREELIRFFTLTAADTAFIDPGRGRGPADRLGLAVQLCTLPWLGFVPDDIGAAPPTAVVRLAERLRVPADALGRYGERGQTRTEHLRAAAHYLGWRPAKALELKELEEFLLARAMEHDAPSLLHRLACECLISAKVVRPGVVVLLERVAAARAAAQALTYDTVAPILAAAPTLVAELDRLLVVDPQLGSTRLHWLGKAPTEPSPGAVKTELAKLRFLRRLDAHTMDLSMLPTERRRFLAAVGRRSSNQTLGRREPQRRYSILLALLAQSATDVLDEVIQLFDQAISARETRARLKTDQQLVERAKAGEDRQALLDAILPVVLDPAIPDEEVGGLLRAELGTARLRAAFAQARARLPRDHGQLGMLDAPYTYLRQFTPGVLAAAAFAGGTGAQELLAAVAVLKELKSAGRGGCPTARRPGPSRPATRGTWTPPARPATPPATATTGSCACCSACGTGYGQGTCGCPGRAATPTRSPTCSPPRSGAASATSSAAWSASRPPAPRRWPRPPTSCTPPWPTWRPCWPRRPSRRRRRAVASGTAGAAAPATATAAGSGSPTRASW